MRLLRVGLRDEVRPILVVRRLLFTTRTRRSAALGSAQWGALPRSCFRPICLVILTTAETDSLLVAPSSNKSISAGGRYAPFRCLVASRGSLLSFQRAQDRYVSWDSFERKETCPCGRGTYKVVNSSNDWGQSRTGWHMDCGFCKSM